MMPEVNSSSSRGHVDGPPFELGEPGRAHEREIDTRGPGFLRGAQDRNDKAPIVHPRRQAEDQEEGLEEVRRNFPPPQGPRYIESPPAVPAPPHRAARTPPQTPPPVEQTNIRSREVDEVVWDVSRTKDVTMHLELDITEDLEPDLDEFCRLARLGNFQGAKQSFKDNLEQHMDDPYIFVQYAQMLMSMGDYKSVEGLKVPYSLEHSKHLQLQINWEFIKVFTALHTEGLSEEDAPLAAEEATSTNTFQKARVKFEQLQAKRDEASLKDNAVDEAESQLGSTECQIVSLALHIEARLHQDKLFIETSILTTIYERLLREGRIWDFRDILIGAVYSYGSTRAFEKFFGSSEVALDRILHDWSTTIYDESTNLALLDILTSVALRRILNPRTFPGTKLWVDEAGILASNIIRYHPSNLKSRQYIRWILAKVAVTNYRDMDSSNELSNLPGLFPGRTRGGELPTYVPVALETPDWHLLRRPSESNETLQTALKAARQLGDLETEVMCLSQLILQAEEPADLFDDLVNLQKTVQNDNRSLLKTCLSKYLICHDKESRDTLREEILSIKDDFGLHPTWLWAKRMVLRALSHSQHEAELLLDEARALPMLSRNVREFMKRNKLEKENGHLHISDDSKDYHHPTASDSMERYEKRKNEKESSRERARMRYEEKESSFRYYERNYPDENYSPSPPRASGGSYYPEHNQFPPPPTGSLIQKFVNTKVARPAPPRNPADYTKIPPAPDDPYPRTLATSDNATVKMQASLNPTPNIPSGAEDAVRNTSPKETEPEIPNFRRPPLVSVSSIKEDED